MKHKTLREWLDYRHPEQWEKLDDKTQEYLDKGERASINDESYEYANSHRASFMISDGHAFYQEATNDEIQNAREQLAYGQQELNPYQLMCNHNYHILKERYVKAVRLDLEALRELLDLDTWDKNTDLQKEIAELRIALRKMHEDHPVVTDQLERRTEFLEKEACHWLEYVEALLT